MKSQTSAIKLLGISGRAQSGKSTLSNFLETKLENVQVFSFGNGLKDICHHLFGLCKENLYGTDDDKNKLTHLKWQNMPGVITDKSIYELLNDDCREYVLYHEPGFMSYREVLEFFGTDICRSMYEDCWIELTLQAVYKEHKNNPDALFIIDDVRGQNEVNGIQSHGGLVYRLMRDPLMRTSKIERMLDSDKFDWNQFNRVINNKTSPIMEKNQEVINLLIEDNLYENNKIKPLLV